MRARIIEIDEKRLAIGARLGLDDVNGRTRRSEIDLVARGLHVVLGIAAIEHEAPGAARERVLDERARE